MGQNRLIQTDDTATEAELRELFTMEPDEEIAVCIPVCAGEWRAEADRWRFYEYSEWRD